MVGNLHFNLCFLILRMYEIILCPNSVFFFVGHLIHGISYSGILLIINNSRPVIKMATVKVPEHKIILCGEFGVGKSSLFRRYAADTFVTATDRKSTLGLDHYEKLYKTKTRDVKVS